MNICVYVMESSSDSDFMVHVSLRAEGGVGNGNGRKVNVVFEKATFKRCGV